MRTSSTALVVLCSLLVLSGCDSNVGEVTDDGGGSDSVIDDPTIAFDNIGKPCVFTPADPSNPNADCGRGLTCLMNAPGIDTLNDGGKFVPGAGGLPYWEDHFTTPHIAQVANLSSQPGEYVGYCALVGRPDICPRTSSAEDPVTLAPGYRLVQKTFGGGVTACLRTCQSDNECQIGGSDMVCEERFAGLLDAGGQGISTCVRKCQADYPDCVRTVIARHPNAPNSAVTMVAMEDVTGNSVCDVDTGHCAATPARGSSAPGGACDTSADCAQNMVCVPPTLFELNPTASNMRGFCARPCKANNPFTIRGTMDAQQQAALLAGSCANDLPGYACQAAGELGFTQTIGPVEDDKGMFAVELASLLPGAAISGGEIGGFCFKTCSTAIDCDPANGFGETQCSPWSPTAFPQFLTVPNIVDLTMCLPRGLVSND